MRRRSGTSAHRLRLGGLRERAQLLVEVRLALERHDVVVGEHDRNAALGRCPGDDIDGRGLDLDEKMSASARSTSSRSCSRRERFDDTVTSAAPCSSRRCRCNSSAADGSAVVKNATRFPSIALDRARTENGRHHGDVLDLPNRLGELLVASSLLRHGQDDEVGEEDAVGVEVADDELRRLVGAGHEHPPPCRDRRDRGAAAVEDHEFGLPSDRLLHSLGDVARPRDAGQPAAGPPAADRRDAAERGRLQIVGRRVRAGAARARGDRRASGGGRRPVAPRALRAPSRRRRGRGRRRAAAPRTP